MCRDKIEKGSELFEMNSRIAIRCEVKSGIEGLVAHADRTGQ